LYFDIETGNAAYAAIPEEGIAYNWEGKGHTLDLQPEAFILFFV
jgi:hypothetical protein